MGWLREVSLATALATCVLTLLILAGRSYHVWMYYLLALPIVYALTALLTFHLLKHTVGDLPGIAALTDSPLVLRRLLLAAAAAGLAEGTACIVLGGTSAWFPRAVATSCFSILLLGVLPLLLVAFQVGTSVHQHALAASSALQHDETSNTATSTSCSDCIGTLTAHIVADARAASQRCGCSRRLPWLHAALTTHDAAPVSVDRHASAPVHLASSAPRGPATPQGTSHRRNSEDGKRLCACSSRTCVFLMEQFPVFAFALRRTALRMRDYSHSTLALFACSLAGSFLPWGEALLPASTAPTDTDGLEEEAVSWWMWALLGLGPVVVASALTDAAGVLFETHGDETHQDCAAGSSQAARPVGAVAPPLAPRAARAAELRGSGSVALRRIGLAVVLSVCLLHTPALTALQLQDQFQHVEQWLLAGQLRTWYAWTGQQHVIAGVHTGGVLGGGGAPAATGNGSALNSVGSNPWSSGGAAAGSGWGGEHRVALRVELDEAAQGELPAGVSAILLTGHNLLASFWHVLVTLIWLALLQAFTLLWQQVLWAAKGGRYLCGDLMWPAQLWFYLQYYTLYCVNDSRPFTAFFAVLVLINIDYYFAAVGGYKVMFEVARIATVDASATVLLQNQQGEKFVHMFGGVQAILRQLSGDQQPTLVASNDASLAATRSLPADTADTALPEPPSPPPQPPHDRPSQRSTHAPRRLLTPVGSPSASEPAAVQLGGVCRRSMDSARACIAVLRPACAAAQSSCWRVAFTESAASVWCAAAPCAARSSAFGAVGGGRQQPRGATPHAASSTHVPGEQWRVVPGETRRAMQYRHEKTYWDAAADISTLLVMGTVVTLLEASGDLNGRLGAAFGFSQTPLWQMWWQLLAMLFARLITTLAASEVQAFQASRVRRGGTELAQGPVALAKTRGTWDHALRESIVHCGFLLLVTLACFQQPGFPMRFAFLDGLS